jgi:copper chaperone
MENVTLKINGMSCGHCVMGVKSALSGLPGVTIHDVQIGSAKVSITAPANLETVKKAIEEEGYEVVEAK